MPPRAAPIPPLYCQLCGVSSAIGRFRTKDEPPSAGWSSSSADGICNHGSDCQNCFTVYYETGLDDEAMMDDEDVEEHEYQYSSDTDAAADPYEYDSPAESDEEDNKENLPAETPSQIEARKRWNDFMDELPKQDPETIVPVAAGSLEQSEHIAGPGCVSTLGYNGYNITAEEMKGSHTFQALCPKPLRRKWRDLDDDEEFEKDPSSTVCLSGLCDWIDARKKTARQFFPHRHNLISPVIGNHVDPKQATRSGFVFHPACFEVYKRASLHRNGRVDIEALMDWFRLEGTPGAFSRFPRAAEVVNARADGWEHRAGDEWLVANPCHVPQLGQLLQDGSGEATDSSIVARNAVANEFPWLWEAWCRPPYSGWTDTTEEDMHNSFKAWETHRSDLEWTLKTFDGDDALDDCDGFPGVVALFEELEDLKDSPPGAMPCTALTLDPDAVHWGKLLGSLRDESRSLKGLRNRERIWKDCQYILRRIERHRLRGRLGDGITVNAAEVHADGPPEYSDDSDDDMSQAVQDSMNLDFTETDDVDITLILDAELA